MNQPPPPDSNPQQPSPNQNLQQNVENSTVGGGIQGIHGDESIQLQGSGNRVLKFVFNLFANRESPARQDYRPRQTLLNQVRNFWVKDVLEKSLHSRVRIELGLEERLDAVAHPWGMVWETPGQLRQTLPPDTRVINKFDEMGAGRSLLILGEPGAGKTTTLLELARDLIDRAEQNVDQPMPVVFNLSSWGSEKPTQTITDWLVQELERGYKVPKQLGSSWIKNQQLLLLLDGLDEVSAKRRNLCVQALNQFTQKYGQTEIVITSRIVDYEALSHRLGFQGAIYLKPLTLEQINHYLTSAGSELAAVKTLIQEEITLQELAMTPLMLSVMAIAYRGRAVEDLPRIKSMEQWREHLFNCYIERMFFRRRAGRQENQYEPNQEKLEQTYSKTKFLYWLSLLAQQMQRESKTEFLIEKMQPIWLRTSAHRLMYRLNGVLSDGLILALSFGLILRLSFGLSAGSSGLIYGLIMGLGAGLIREVYSGLGPKEEIKTIETIKWSCKTAKQKLINQKC